MKNFLKHKQMKKWFSLPVDKFDEYIPRVDVKDSGYLYYKDNGSDVLAVAHLDSVQKPEHLFITDKYIFSPVLDDRLGVYIIMDLLPKLGINVDILFTNGEETGFSTAELFKPDKKYNWMVEFDRMGDDVVMYDYETENYKEKIKEFFPKTSWGSFSDISYLEHLGCFGFNIGVGYQDYHQINAYADISMLLKNVRNFSKFYKKYKNVKLEHTERAEKYDGHYNDYNYEYGCWICGRPLLTPVEKQSAYCEEHYHEVYGEEGYLYY